MACPDRVKQITLIHLNLLDEMELLMSIIHPPVAEASAEPFGTALRLFFQHNLAPLQEMLETGCLDTFSKAWALLADKGLCGTTTPTLFGGTDWPMPDYCLLLEILGEISPSLATALSVHTSVGCYPLLLAGTELQKNKYLPLLASGEWLAAFGLTEPNAGSDAVSGNTRAERVERNGQTGYLLNGAKIFITNAMHAQLFLLTARTAQAPGEKPRQTAFIVERQTPGFSIFAGEEKLGLKGSSWGELHFHDCFIPLEQRLGPEHEGFTLFMNALNVGRIGIASISLGIAQACVKYLAECLKLQPDGQHDCWKETLASLATETMAARHLILQAAKLKQACRPFAQEASMAKLYASELCNRAAERSLTAAYWFGHHHLKTIERLACDARVMTLVEGTSEIQRLFISRKILS